MSLTFEFDGLDLVVSCMELSEKFFSLKNEDQQIFVDYIKSEYDTIDEFTNLVNDIFFSFNLKTQADMEFYLDKLTKHYDEKNILMVISSMIEYLNDMIEYIEYQ
jgi:hypothetical protein